MSKRVSNSKGRPSKNRVKRARHVPWWVRLRFRARRDARLRARVAEIKAARAAKAKEQP